MSDAMRYPPAVRVAWLVSSVALLGCGERAAPQEHATREPTVPTVLAASHTEPEVEAPEVVEPEALAPLPDPADAPFLPGTFTHAALLEALASTPTRLFKPTGTSALVFRTRLRSEHTMAFKPRTRTHRDGWQREIAAYRIARLLGLTNVPPATARRIPAREIRERLQSDYAGPDTWRELYGVLVPEPNDEVPGAAIYWVPDMSDLGLDRGRELARWKTELTQAGPGCAEDRRALCRDLSNMLAFDYLIANWDRFSGGNVQGLTTSEGPRVVVRDHDVALASSIPSEIHDRVRERLGWTERFSRGLVDSVRRLDRAAIVRALETEPEHATSPLLSDAAIDALLERRETLLSYVGSLVDRYGDEAVLGFE